MAIINLPFYNEDAFSSASNEDLAKRIRETDASNNKKVNSLNFVPVKGSSLGMVPISGKKR